MSGAVNAPVPAAESMPGATQSGLLNINKPCGVTSFRIVKEVRRILGAKKVGHCGTLDPMASGVLLVVFGRPATRLVPSLMSGQKIYRARVRLGVRTDTGDVTGKVLEESAVPVLHRELLETDLREFTGTIEQVPPMHSALKYGGKKLYEYARKGIVVDRAPRAVQIYSLELTGIFMNEFEFRAVCSKGTYVRTLAEDIGKRLGLPATLSGLVREAVGSYRIDESLPGESLLRMDRQALLECVQQPTAAQSPTSTG